MARIPYVFALLGFAALPALSAVPVPSGLASRLLAGPDEEPVFMLSARGTNLFQCKARVEDPNTHAWYFVAPEAILYEGTRPAGTHRAVGQFESDSDRTSVFGMLRATQHGGADNLPWAAMRAAPTGDSGMFGGVTTIQRVNTAGGVAPAEGCTAANAGNETRVNFSADYYFYKRRGAG
jgi:hypothetical protein